MRTSFPKPQAAPWYLVDAKDKVLGRLCVDIATVLKGKYAPSYVPHLPCGGHVIVINAEQVRLTGRKGAQKVYYRHTGYFGHLKETSVKEYQEKDPGRIVHLAVKGMLPKNAMREHLLKRLHVYSGALHQHEAQKPLAFPL